MKVSIIGYSTLIGKKLVNYIKNETDFINKLSLFDSNYNKKSLKFKNEMIKINKYKNQNLCDQDAIILISNNEKLINKVINNSTLVIIITNKFIEFKKKNIYIINSSINLLLEKILLNICTNNIIKRIDICGYLPVSEEGNKGIKELNEGLNSLYPSLLSHRHYKIKNNIIPQVTKFTSNHTILEEKIIKKINELFKVDIINVILFKMSIYRNTYANITITLQNNFDISRFYETLDKDIIVFKNNEKNEFPTNEILINSNNTYIGRVNYDNQTKILSFFTGFDSLIAGYCNNSIQIIKNYNKDLLLS